jgi:predicted RNase H-like HicB family nuclease
MRIHGTIEREGKWWAVAVASLGVFTQGRTRAEAFAMAQDAVKILLDRPDVKVRVEEANDGDGLTVQTNPSALLVGFMLRCRREAAGLTLVEAAKRLGQSSVNAYARYEQGRAMPTIEQLDRLLLALDRHRGLVLSV